ncbi:MAG: TetR/AcrR family transcriptional regulator, partial [Clostridioides difficile]
IINSVHNNFNKRGGNMPKILENVKEDILKVSRDMILEEDYSNISIRKIAQRCGISAGTVYNYFNSKQEIIEYITKSEWDLLIRRIEYSNKNTEDYIKKLNIIFTEIRNFINKVHNIQYNDFLNTFETERFFEMKKHKDDFHEQLSNKVYEALEKESFFNNDKLVCNIIIKMFFSYSTYLHIEFEDLKPYIEKLIH